ncbi:MAG: primosomal protein N' [Zavarzinella sp.]
MELFHTDEPTEPASTTTFVDVVLDRPLDHPFCYSVPAEIQPHLAVGKRVEIPFGRGDRTTVGYIVGIHNKPPAMGTKAVQRVIDDEALLTDRLLRLTRWMADYYVCSWGTVLQAVLPAGVRDYSGTRTAAFVQAMPEAERPQPLPKLTTKQQATWELILDSPDGISIKDCCQNAKVGPAVIQSLLAKGLIHKFTERVENVDEEPTHQPTAAPLVLNPDQERVWQAIQRAIQQNDFQPLLLHGVTGSGKTEVYLQAIEEVLRQGKEVIVLVPEISLTPQTIERFRGRCGSIAVMHSNLTDRERGNYWRKIANGQVQVVVGARSAIFAPTKNLGLIVIDEEHESTFKQESTPRYHGRDVAVMRARLENIPIIMGSATPSLESWANSERGQYVRLSLPNRVAERAMPPVRLIDMRYEPRRKGFFRAISPTLETEMQHTLRGQGQVILLLNRRGFATYIHCPSCGYVAGCPHCDLTLTFHRCRNLVMCHFCGHEEVPEKQCNACGQTAMLFQGLGTEKLQLEVEELFPNHPVARMDSDTMHRPGAHQQTLESFRKHETHILLGTQMIAKGLDFPNVTLVGVINADASLHMPDFRAGERTFQLLAQVAGRAGRGDRPGQVLIQTYTPEHPSIACAAHHDYLKFVAHEIAERQQHSYPPFQRLVRLIIRSKKEESARETAEQLAGAFENAIRRMKERPTPPAGVRILGPMEAPVYRLNDYFRFHFQLQSRSASVLHELLTEVTAVVRPTSTVEYQIDVDPYNML